MKNNIPLFFINLLISFVQGAIFSLLGYFMVIILKMPVIAVICFMIGFTQIQSASDTQKIQNDIFDLKEMLKKNNESKRS